MWGEKFNLKKYPPTMCLGFPSASVVKNPSANAGDMGWEDLNPWVGKISWRRKWQLTPVFLPGKSHGQRDLAGYSSWESQRVRHHLATKQQYNVYQISRCTGHRFTSPCTNLSFFSPTGHIIFSIISMYTRSLSSIAPKHRFLRNMNLVELGT